MRRCPERAKRLTLAVQSGSGENRKLRSAGPGLVTHGKRAPDRPTVGAIGVSNGDDKRRLADPKWTPRNGEFRWMSAELTCRAGCNAHIADARRYRTGGSPFRCCFLRCTPCCRGTPCGPFPSSNTKDSFSSCHHLLSDRDNAIGLMAAVQTGQSAWSMLITHAG